MKKTTDMTTGTPFTKIIIFAIPIALGFILQTLYSLGDTLIVSLSRGSTAMTGVNLTGSLGFLVTGFAQGVSAGFGIKLSQFVGAKDEKKMRNSFAVSIVLTLIIGVIISVSFALLGRPILVAMHTNEIYIDYATSYITTIFGGMIFTIFYNLSDQVLRAMGDSRTPLYVLIVCALLNVGLNSLLFVTDLGVEWAGYATVISQAISAIIGFARIFTKFPQLRLKKEDFSFTKKFVAEHLGQGLPMAFQFTVTATGCMIQQGAFNSLDSPVYSFAQSTASKIDNFFSAGLNGCGTAMATYVGQNFGAKRFDRIRSGARSAWIIGLIFTVFFGVADVLCSVPVARFLVKDENATQEFFDLVLKYQTIQASFYYFLFMIFCFRQCVQGIGYSGISLAGGVIEFLARLVVSSTVAVRYGFIGACLSNPTAWVFAGVWLAVGFYVILNKLEKKNARNLRVGTENPTENPIETRSENPTDKSIEAEVDGADAESNPISGKTPAENPTYETIGAND